jgi:hypothetical protein
MRQALFFKDSTAIRPTDRPCEEAVQLGRVARAQTVRPCSFLHSDAHQINGLEILFLRRKVASRLCRGRHFPESPHCIGVSIAFAGSNVGKGSTADRRGRCVFLNFRVSGPPPARGGQIRRLINGGFAREFGVSLNQLQRGNHRSREERQNADAGDAPKARRPHKRGPG